MQISDKGLGLIKAFEGFRAKPYRDPVGIPTVAYGATYYPDGRRVRLSDPPMTEAEGEMMLRHQVRAYADGIARYAQVALNQNQFDALTSWAYNVGLEAARTSTLMRKLNAKDYQGAANELPRWNRAGGKVLAGLTRRREAERALFLEPCGRRP